MIIGALTDCSEIFTSYLREKPIVNRAYLGWDGERPQTKVQNEVRGLDVIFLTKSVTPPQLPGSPRAHLECRGSIWNAVGS